MEQLSQEVQSGSMIDINEEKKRKISEAIFDFLYFKGEQIANGDIQKQSPDFIWSNENVSLLLKTLALRVKYEIIKFENKEEQN